MQIFKIFSLITKIYNMFLYNVFLIFIKIKYKIFNNNIMMFNINLIYQIYFLLIVMVI
jgi:hypothetical protein